jgi:hypothetical protein
MYAYEIPGLRFSMPAGGAVALHRFVSVADEQAIQATAGTAVIGVSMNEVGADELNKNPRIVEIANGIVMVEAAAAITSGVAVASDAEGKATTAGEGNACGVAITGATAAGQLVAVKL